MQLVSAVILIRCSVNDHVEQSHSEAGISHKSMFINDTFVAMVAFTVRDCESCHYVGLKHTVTLYNQ